MPRPIGAGAREWARRLRPLLAAGLALLATAAGWPSASHDHVHAVLAAHYVRPGPGESGVVLQLPGNSRTGSLAVPVAHLSPASRADAVAPLRRLLQADVLVVAPTSLPRGGAVKVAGLRTERLRVGGFGTVGIRGIDAVVSKSVARSLGLPAGNAIVVSAPHARLDALTAQIKKLIPGSGHAVAEALVSQAAGSGVAASTGAAGAPGSVAADGPGLTSSELVRFLKAAESRIGLPYVWGAAGPRSFDCSGLVQWSLAQAGVVMPRVAVDQARTGPMVPAAQLQPGDLLFYHTDPTAPTYISHVAIYLGNNMMLQAPRPGLDVQVVPLDTGAGFAGAVRVYPRVAAGLAG